MRNKLTLLIIFFGLISLQSFATHNRAGEITYEHVSGFTYKVTVTTYTDIQSYTADRCELEVFFGDGTSAFVQRTNGLPCTGLAPSCIACGDSISATLKLNKYEINHTYPGTGTFKITMEDPNRNSGVVNIPNSINQVFSLYAELIIFPSGVPNSSPYLHYPPIDDACLNEIYEHNPGAVDQDISNNGESDSLVFSLVSCLGSGGNPIPNYTLPDQWPAGASNNISIDSQTGTLVWNSPKIVGEYNVAILIEEYRKVGSSVIRVGSVLRDLQIDVTSCNVNNPPVIQPISDVCITATDVLLKTVTAIDNDLLPNGNYQEVTLQAKGDPFEVQGNKATFPEKTDERVVSSEFRWSTQCNHIRSYPYFVVFRANDNAPKVNLVDYYDWRISVIGPAPTGLTTEPAGSRVQVSWAYSTCTNAIGYRIYRKSDSIGYVAPNCETGIPASTGYQLIGTTTGASSTTFIDDGNGNGLVIGEQYCYMVYAYFEDGSESYPSVESCATLNKEVPIITRVSVNSTSASIGSDTIKWSKPTDMDSIKHPGPYKYTVLRKAATGGFTPVFTSSSNMDLGLIDSIFVDSNLNTEEVKYSYKIEIYSDDSLVGASSSATSPFLLAKPLDNRLELFLDIDVPWQNYNMLVYRMDNLGAFNFIGTSSSLVYTDSNLINGKEYCYYVTTEGLYSDTTLERPLMNNSQIVCAPPKDLQAPCAPENVEIESDCKLFYNTLSWLNPNDVCDTTDDVVSYNIYYKQIELGESQIIETVIGAENTSITFSDLSSVAGCYYVTAVDSFNNESEPSNSVCVDNCPYYELPNVFTPGVDGVNDFLTPLPEWRYVDRVEMRVYNRWGDEVYFTTDPELGWDGNSPEGELMAEGVYFYVCNVYEIRLQGIVERVLKGTITLLREKPGQPSN